MPLKELPFHLLVGPFNPPAMLGQKWYSSCLSDSRCLGDYLHHPNIHSFFTASEVFAQSLIPGTYPQAEAPLRGPRLSLGEHFCLQPIIDESREKHPVDAVLWWGFQNGFPLDLDRIEVPLFVVMSDWHNDKPLAQLLQSVDGVFCDEKLRQHLLQHHRGFENKVKYWPAYSFEPSLIAAATQLETERDIDVLFVGNTNPHKYLQRNQFLFRIAHLPHIKVHIACGVSEVEHLALLRRSKIAFNHALRQEMNLRAYEAAACGALLFMEQDNLEVDKFLEPGVSYIPYTAQNVESQIHYYLEHPEARERIAKQGQASIRSCHYTARFGELLQSLQSIRNPSQETAPHLEVGFKKVTRVKTSEDFLLAHILVHVTTDLAGWRTHGARELEDQWRKQPQSLSFANALLVVLADLFVHPIGSKDPAFVLPEISLQYIQQVLDNTVCNSLSSPQPFHLLIAYNLAWSYFFQSNYVQMERALQAFQQLIQQFSWPVFTALVESSFFVLPIRYTGFYLYYQESASVGQVQLGQVLVAGVAFLQGCLQRLHAKHTDAISSFELCTRLVPGLVEAYFERAGVHIDQGQYQRAEQALAQGLYQGVFFKSAWKKYFELLDRRVLSMAEEHQKARLIQVLQRLSLD